MNVCCMIYTSTVITVNITFDIMLAEVMTIVSYYLYWSVHMHYYQSYSYLHISLYTPISMVIENGGRTALIYSLRDKTVLGKFY